MMRRSVFTCFFPTFSSVFLPRFLQALPFPDPLPLRILCLAGMDFFTLGQVSILLPIFFSPSLSENLKPMCLHFFFYRYPYFPRIGNVRPRSVALSLKIFRFLFPLFVFFFCAFSFSFSDKIPSGLEGPFQIDGISALRPCVDEISSSFPSFPVLQLILTFSPPPAPYTLRFVNLPLVPRATPDPLMFLLFFLNWSREKTGIKSMFFFFSSVRFPQTPTFLLLPAFACPGSP